MWSSDKELDSVANEKAAELLTLLQHKLKIAFSSTIEKGNLTLTLNPMVNLSEFVKKVIPKHLCSIQVNTTAYRQHFTTVTCYRENMDKLIEALTLADEAVFVPRPGLQPPALC